jgi:hypothetical protein
MRRPSVRSPPKRRLTCPRVRTSPRPCRGAHLTRVSALSGPGTRPVSGQLSGTAGGGASHRGPGSCCLSATGLGLSGHPVPARELGLPHGRLTRHNAPGPGRGFHVPHQRATTGMGASSTPGTAVLSWPDAVPGQRLPLPSGQSLPPRTHNPSRGSAITGHQRRFTRFTRPACPSPVIPGWDGNPRAFPCAPRPAVTGSARQGGTGREHAPGTTRPT